MPRKKNSEDFYAVRESIHREILSAVSHDLKTPLASIIGSLEVHEKLGSKLSAEKQEILLKTALSEAHRLDNFITNILDMARLENQMVRIKKEPLQLKGIISDCLIKLGYKVDSSNINVSGEDVNIHSDSNLLCRALYLVVENAMKHAGDNPVIDVSYGGDEKDYFIRVKDNGPGIPDNKINEIFLKYTRITRKDPQNAGTGLGLAICRQIVTLLGGKVTAANIQKGGAVFDLKFHAA